MRKEDDIGDSGERVVGTIHDFNFYSHLSVYEFALPFLSGKDVLDCGCGTGYGSDRLARNGAKSVCAIDYSKKAVDFAKIHFSEGGAKFSTADMNYPLPFEDGSFDAIFSSQAMEHISQIDFFFSECCRVLAPGGIFVSSVPAIVRARGARSLEENISNVYHITNLTPLGWYSKTCRFFEEVTPYFHWVTPQFDGSWEDIQRLAALNPSETKIRESDFIYKETTIDFLNEMDLNLNTVLVSRVPRPKALPHVVDEFIPPEWAEGTISAEVRTRYGNAIAESLSNEIKTANSVIDDLGQQLTKTKKDLDLLKLSTSSELEVMSATNEELKHQLAIASNEIALLKKSNSWKITAPLRALRGFK